jgi:uncharacterized protein (TIGR03000 family)
MNRFIYVLLALAAFASIGSAQPRQLPLSPAIPAVPAARQPAQGNMVFFPVALPWGLGMGWGYQTYNPWTGFGYVYGGILPTEVAVNRMGTPVVAPLMTAGALAVRRTQPVVRLAEEFPATLALQFPAAAEVWLDGKKVSGVKEEQVLTSPVLKPTQTYTFLVKARWRQGGKNYEANRAVTVGPNEHSRLLILSGDEVREQAPPPRAVSD